MEPVPLVHPCLGHALLVLRPSVLIAQTAPIGMAPLVWPALQELIGLHHQTLKHQLHQLDAFPTVMLPIVKHARTPLPAKHVLQDTSYMVESVWPPVQPAPMDQMESVYLAHRIVLLVMDLGVRSVLRVTSFQMNLVSLSVQTEPMDRMVCV